MMDNLLLGICILLIGVMFYYFNGRLSILESTIVKQNHVLSDFITNVKSNTSVKVQENTSNHGATLEAMHVAKGHGNALDMEYIEVTDSEDDDSTSSEDTVSNTVEPSEVKVIQLGEITDSRTLDTLFKENKVEPSEVKVIQLGEITDSRTLDTLFKENKVEPSVVKVIQLGDITDSRTLDTLFKENTVEEPLEEDDDGITVDIHDGSTIDYSKMKISQLRLILADKGIVPKGKKKLDLVNALQETNL